MALTDEQMIERLRRNYDAFNRGDFDAIAETAHPDIVLVRAGGQGELIGVESVRAWMEPDAFESQVVEPVEFRVRRNKVIVRLRSTMRGAGSGLEMEIGAWTVWSFGEDGRITRAEIFLGHEEAEAVNALEAD